jgi:hypothetical protein
MLVVAVLVVAITPSPSTSDPVALSGSTTPARITRTVTQGDDVVRIAAFTPIPNAVAANPSLHADDGDESGRMTAAGRLVAKRLPGASESVLVQTDHATYRVVWADVQWLDIDGYAVIANESLAIIGYIDHGQFYPLVDR